MHLPTPGSKHLALVALVLVLTSAPNLVAASGFEKLKWGMDRDAVLSAYPGETLEFDATRSRPQDTNGSGIRIIQDVFLFGLPVQVEAHFHHEQLAVVRLTLAEENESNIEKIINIYRSSAGPPLRNIRSGEGRKTTTWSWPWEGLEFRSVSENGEVRYQRVDISQTLQRSWLSADAAACSILPGSSSCNLDHHFCPSEGSQKRPPQTNMLDVAGKPGEVTCSYEGEQLARISLAIPEANDVTADWLQLILESRLGKGQEVRDDRGSRSVQLRTSWNEHGVDMLVVRKAYVETKKGWTGPVDFLKIRRSVTQSTDSKAAE